MIVAIPVPSQSAVKALLYGLGFGCWLGQALGCSGLATITYLPWSIPTIINTQTISFILFIPVFLLKSCLHAWILFKKLFEIFFKLFVWFLWFPLEIYNLDSQGLIVRRVYHLIKPSVLLYSCNWSFSVDGYSRRLSIHLRWDHGMGVQFWGAQTQPRHI